MAQFQILLTAPDPVRSLQTPPAVENLRGTAYQESAVAGICELADGSRPYAGFVTRDIKINAPTLEQISLYGYVPVPHKAGGQATFEKAEQVALESASFLDASITAAVPLKSEITFAAGKAALATAGKLVEFIVTCVGPGLDDPAAVRVILDRVQSYKKA